MKNTYQIKINQGKEAQTLDIPLAGPKGHAVTVKALAGARYQLIDTTSNFGPENIRVSRQGKDMKVSFEGSNTTDLVIEDYYKVSPEGYNGLIGEAESGKFYEYIPESASGLASVPMLGDTSPVVGMALGGMEVAPAGAAVGLLAAGLFSPWIAGAGALGVAAAAGGGSSSTAAVVTPDTTKPTGQTGALAAASDSGVKDNVTNVTKPTIEGVAEANAKVSVTLKDENGVVSGPYTTTADANGKYSVTITDTLVDASPYTKGTQFTPLIKVTDAASNFSEVLGTPFKVDTSVPNVSVNINNDTNNNGTISYLENTDPTKLKIQSSVGSQYVNAGDKIFASFGNEKKFHTIDQVDIDSASNSGIISYIFEFVANIIDAVKNVAVTSWFIDLMGNDGSAKNQIATDSANVDLKVAVSIKSIAGDDVINKVESANLVVPINGTATASGIVWLTVGSTVVGSVAVAADGTWSVEVTMSDTIKNGGSLKAELKPNSGGAVLASDLIHSYSFDERALATTDTDGKLTAAENLAYKPSSTGIWTPLLIAGYLTDSGKYFLADASGNIYKPPGTGATDQVVAYSALNKSNTPAISSDLTVSQLLASSDGLHIDYASLVKKNINPAVKSVNLADGKANIMSIDTLDVLNHGVWNVLEAGLGQNPQFKVFGDASGDILKLTNLLGGKGIWTQAETVTLIGDTHAYTNYSAYALGLDIDLLVDKNIDVKLV